LMKVLIACEQSGVIRRAFRGAGHSAFSCDLLESEDDSPHHLQCDIREVLIKQASWDLMIAHPDCTYLTNSAEWCYKDNPGKNMRSGVLFGEARRQARVAALEFVRMLMAADIQRIAIENPVGKIGADIRPADQYIQPYEYGHDASKRTGLWLKNLPLLRPTSYIHPRMVLCSDGKRRPRWGNQTDSGQNKLAPSEDRWKLRARTYEGWAEAMADQWGGY